MEQVGQGQAAGTGLGLQISFFDYSDLQRPGCIGSDQHSKIVQLIMSFSVELSFGFLFEKW